MKYLVAIMFVFASFSCSLKENDVVITELRDDDEGRPIFNVKINNVLYEHFYAEEIANALITGEWKRNQDLVITESSEFQLFMEEDSVVIYDFGRKVGAIANGECNKLDDVLNQE